MPLSSDPDKRSRQIENLRRGPEAAAQRHGLPVVPYAEPKAKPTAASEAAEPPSADLETASSPLLVLAGAGALVLVLVLILNRTGAPHAA